MSGDICWMWPPPCYSPWLALLNPSPGGKLLYCCKSDQQIRVHCAARPSLHCLWNTTRPSPFLGEEDFELVWLFRAGLLQFFVCRRYQLRYLLSAADLGCSSSRSFHSRWFQYNIHILKSLCFFWWDFVSSSKSCYYYRICQIPFASLCCLVPHS